MRLKRMAIAGAIVIAAIVGAYAVNAAVAGSRGRPYVGAVASAAPSSASPVPSAQNPAPASTDSPATRTQLLGYIAAHSTIRDVDESTLDEYSSLVCQTLRSRTMSPTFFARLQSIEEKGYSLTDAKATDLLTATARYACPDALPVIQRKGGISDSR